MLKLYDYKRIIAFLFIFVVTKGYSLLIRWNHKYFKPRFSIKT